MNVIFLDFDGVLETYHYNSLADIERRIKLLADICNENNCKIVIEATSKDAIDEKTMEVMAGSWINKIFELFKKYGIECIGRTPNVERKIGESAFLSTWKEDEILKYLEMHSEIEHYCIIDDDDTKSIMHWNVSDLEKVREHLVTPLYYSINPDEEGLLPKHKDEIVKILNKKYKS